jgi:hypothetical protein
MAIKKNNDNLDSWDWYEMGYFESAIILLNKWTQYGECRAIFLPALFMLRHFLELSLKGILISWFKIKDDQASFKKIEGHSLVKIWKMGEKIIKERWPDDKYDEADRISYFSSVDKLIENLNDIDRTSTRLRYPSEKRTFPDMFYEIEKRPGIDSFTQEKCFEEVGILKIGKESFCLQDIEGVLYGVSAALRNDIENMNQYFE